MGQSLMSRSLDEEKEKSEDSQLQKVNSSVAFLIEKNVLSSPV